MSSNSSEIIVIDGCGDRYRVLDYSARFTLQSVDRGTTVTVDSAQLRDLGIEWDGRTLQEVGQNTRKAGST
jgi:hypothetical protein